MRRVYLLHTTSKESFPHQLDLHPLVGGDTIERLQRDVAENIQQDEQVLHTWVEEGGWVFMQTSYCWYVITRLTLLEEGD